MSSESGGNIINGAIEAFEGSSESGEKKRRFPRLKLKKIFIYLGLVVIFLALISFSVFSYLKYQEAQNIIETETLIFDEAREQKENQELIEKIARLAVLPENETPTVATITDKERLSSQDFFLKAENGDKVLVYPNNKVAVLYRPSVDKIINLATNISVISPTPTAAASAATTSAELSPTQSVFNPVLGETTTSTNSSQ